MYVCYITITCHTITTTVANFLYIVLPKYVYFKIFKR